MYHRLHGLPQIILSEKSRDNLHNLQSCVGTLCTQRAWPPYPACLHALPSVPMHRRDRGYNEKGFQNLKTQKMEEPAG